MQIVEYNVTDAAIAEMQSRFMALTVKGLDDNKGLAEVHKARMVVKGKRIEVEKRRKELKADALDWSKKVDSEARRITKLLEPIESHLESEEEKITKEKERIRLEAEAKIRAENEAIEKKRMEIAQERVDSLAKVGVAIPFQSAKFMEELDYNSLLRTSTESFKIEQARIAEERRKDAERIEAENKARAEEAKRLAAERAELDKARAEEAKKKQEQEAILRAEREKIEAEKRKIEEAKREQERHVELERAKKEAAERAVREAQEKIEREAREKAEAEQRAKEEAERQERLKPDKEKLIAYANSLLVDIELQTEPAKAILMEAYNRLTKVKTFIIKAAKEL